MQRAYRERGRGYCTDALDNIEAILAEACDWVKIGAREATIVAVAPERCTLVQIGFKGKGFKLKLRQEQ